MMNCPKCNKEVSPEWKLCPFCGYEPKKCNNPDHASRWLPHEAKFCPECGEPLNDKKMPSQPTVSKERYVSVGDILCTDNTTVPVSDWPVAGKYAMGVVFYVDNSGQHGWAVHLYPQGEFQWTPNGKEREVYGLKKCESEAIALDDEDGFENTRIIRLEGDKSDFPAAYAMYYDHGWYLPAMGQLKKLYDHRKDLNTSLLKVKGKKIRADWYWSSTQHSSSYAWFMLPSGTVRNNRKQNAYKVRSVRTF